VYLPYGLTVLSIRAGKIDEIMAFLTPDVFSRFDLPASIAADATANRRAAYARIGSC
jgi:hypothetical protein